MTHGWTGSETGSGSIRFDALVGIGRRRVDQEIDAAEALGGCRHQGSDVAVAAQIGMDEQAADVVRDRARRLVLNIGESDLDAGGRKRPHQSGADAAGASGDDRNLAGQPLHGDPFRQ